MAVDIKRALTDEACRATLTEEELALLPKDAGSEGKLSDDELERVAGGSKKLVVPRGSNS
jgi:mersacidin/lichenicidin family type 2 lantibiotic